MNIFIIFLIGFISFIAGFVITGTILYFLSKNKLKAIQNQKIDEYLADKIYCEILDDKGTEDPSDDDIAIHISHDFDISNYMH